MLWAGKIFLVLLLVDLWHRPKAKKKDLNMGAMVVEGGLGALFLLLWVLGKFGR